MMSKTIDGISNDAVHTPIFIDNDPDNDRSAKAKTGGAAVDLMVDKKGSGRIYQQGYTQNTPPNRGFSLAEGIAPTQVVVRANKDSETKIITIQQLCEILRVGLKDNDCNLIDPLVDPSMDDISRAAKKAQQPFLVKYTSEHIAAMFKKEADAFKASGLTLAWEKPTYVVVLPKHMKLQLRDGSFLSGGYTPPSNKYTIDFDVDCKSDPFVVVNHAMTQPGVLFARTITCSVEQTMTAVLANEYFHLASQTAFASTSFKQLSSIAQNYSRGVAAQKNQNHTAGFLKTVLNQQAVGIFKAIASQYTDKAPQFLDETGSFAFHAKKEPISAYLVLAHTISKMNIHNQSPDPKSYAHAVCVFLESIYEYMNTLPTDHTLYFSKILRGYESQREQQPGYDMTYVGAALLDLYEQGHVAEVQAMMSKFFEVACRRIKSAAKKS